MTDEPKYTPEEEWRLFEAARQFRWNRVGEVVPSSNQLVMMVGNLEHEWEIGTYVAPDCWVSMHSRKRYRNEVMYWCPILMPLPPEWPASYDGPYILHNHNPWRRIPQDNKPEAS